MISQLINYLITDPTPATSPMALALNQTALLSELGATVTAVNLVDTRDTDGNPPYCRFYDTGEVQTIATFLAGQQKRVWLESLAMQVECAAYGATPGIAGARADYLRLAVEGKLQQLISPIMAGALDVRTDLAGSSSTDEIKKIMIMGGKSGKPPQGPGDDVDNPQWTVTRTTRVEMWVLRTRMAS